MFTLNVCAHPTQIHINTLKKTMSSDLYCKHIVLNLASYTK